MFKKKLLTILVLTIFFSVSFLLPSKALAASCKATIDKQEIKKGESFTLNITFSDNETHKFFYVFSFDNGTTIGNPDISSTENPYSVVLTSPNDGFTGLTVRIYDGKPCDASAVPDTYLPPEQRSGPENFISKDLCSLNSVTYSKDNQTVHFSVSNTDPKGSTHEFRAGIQNSSQYKVEKNVRITGKNGGDPTVDYYLPITSKTPAGLYGTYFQIKISGYYLDCNGSGKYGPGPTVKIDKVGTDQAIVEGTVQKVEQPVTKFNTLGGIITALVPNIFALAGFLALIFIIIGGIRYALARGDQKAIDSARGVITNAVTGLIIILVVFVLYEIITAVFKFNIAYSPQTLLAQSSSAPVDIGCAVKFGNDCISFAFPTFGSFVTTVVAALFSLAGLVFFVMLLWGGIRYMLSQGDEKAVKEARTTLTSAFVGLLIVISAFAIITLIGFFTGQTGLLP